MEKQNKKKAAFLESHQPLERTEIWVNVGTVIRLFLGGAQCSSEVLQTLELCGTYIIPSSHRDSWGRGSATSCWSELSSSSSWSSSSPYPRESETQQTGITSDHIGYLPLAWAHIFYIGGFLKNCLFFGRIRSSAWHFSRLRRLLMFFFSGVSISPFLNPGTLWHNTVF